MRVPTEAEWAEVDAQKRRWLSGEDTRSLAEFKASLAGGIVARTPRSRMSRVERRQAVGLAAVVLLAVRGRVRLPDHPTTSQNLN